MSCCDNAPKRAVFSEEFLKDNSEKKTIGDIIVSLSEEDIARVAVDIDGVKSFIEDLKKITTLKQLSLVPNIESRFEDSFKNVGRALWFIQELETVSKVFAEITSELEMDYFKVMLSLEEDGDNINV